MDIKGLPKMKTGIQEESAGLALADKKQNVYKCLGSSRTVCFRL